MSDFKSDGLIDKYIPLFLKLYKKGDGKILDSILEIFKREGLTILSPKKVSNSFFFNNSELCNSISNIDKIDLNKSINLLNDLSKYDNAQAAVIVNGYIIAIEAAEGTDNLLERVALVRKKINQLNNKAGLLVKIPKKNQSRLIDLPVIGLRTLKLVKKANLKGIAINAQLTIVHNKDNLLKFAKENKINIYKI